MGKHQAIIPKVSPSPEEVFKPTRRDALYTAFKAGLGSGIPIFGGVAAELFSAFVAAPSAKRLEEFLTSVDEGLKALETKFEDFSYEDLAESETFTSTVIQATQAAIRTSSDAKRTALRNCVLNAALPKSLGENRQATFVRLCDELTEAHLNILKLFEGAGIPSLDLSNRDWRMDIALDELANLIEASYPEYEGQFDFYVQIIDDLHSRGLISNLIPGKGFPSAIHNEPTLTPFAREFLSFLKSPVGENETDH